MLGAPHQQSDLKHCVMVSLRESPELWPVVEKSYVTNIASVYGDQSEALEKIYAGRDRDCQLLMEGAAPMGLVTCKNHLTDEYQSYGLSSAFEIKTLVVFESESSSGRGYGSQLLLSAVRDACHLGAHSLLVTVSSVRPEALGFFRRWGFEVVDTVSSRGSNDVEFLLSHHSSIVLKRELGSYLFVKRQSSSDAIAI